MKLSTFITLVAISSLPFARGASTPESHTTNKFNPATLDYSTANNIEAFDELQDTYGWETPDFYKYGDDAARFLASGGLVKKSGDGYGNGGAVNSPKNRQAWYDGFDIHTHYEYKTPNTGRVREYFFEVTEKDIAPDGYIKHAMVVNGQYPGPTVRGDWGDIFRIHVTNRLNNTNGTGIHWHGLRQYHTPFQDGVSGVTECPIPPGQSKTYEWRAHQYGTSWWHSHFSLQYPDGLVGAIVINGPTSANYDVDLGPVILSDWFHADAFSLWHLDLQGTPPVADSNVMNGHGYYACCPLTRDTVTGQTDPNCVPRNASRYEVNFVKGKKYKMRLINTSAATQFTFWIDGHRFQIVATDFVPIEPYYTDTLNIAIGQRYEIIVEANANFDHGTNFWINARDCTNLKQQSGLGIIRYDPKSQEDPYTYSYTYSLAAGTRQCFGCRDEPADRLNPIVKENIGPAANPDYNTTNHELVVQLQGYPNISNPNSTLNKWVLDGNTSMYLNWERPTLGIEAYEQKDGLPALYAPIYLNYGAEDYVYFIIVGQFSANDAKRYRTVPIGHPIHLHGHNFAILDQGTEPFNPANFTLNFKNPARRDTILLPTNGYLIMAFKTNNPGVWLMHCHIAWHVSSGLALQFVERQAEIPGLTETKKLKSSFAEECKAWTKHYNMKGSAKQVDSGV